MIVGIHIFVMLALFIVGWAVAFSGALEENDKAFSVGLSMLGLTVALLVFYIIGACKCGKLPGDNNMTNSRYYMRRGYIENDLYYQYMVDIGGGFKANKVRSNNATLYYADGNYRVEWYTRTKKWLYFTEEETIYKIYIPEGSITDDYSVDLR